MSGDFYEIYTTSTCHWCVKAKELLREKNCDFEEIDVTNAPEIREELLEKTGGRRTVPQIFRNGIHVGGYEDLENLLLSEGS